MKKRISCILALLFILTLTGCSGRQPGGQSASSAPEETNGISECILIEEGEHFLVLPISKSKVSVRDEYTRYLEDIDLDLLKSAEEIISDQISLYSENSGFYLQMDEGCLYLAVEVIKQIDPPTIDPSTVEVEGGYEVSGCNIDHEHIFFSERISK